MKTLRSFARMLPIVAAIGVSAALVSEPAAANRGGGHGGGGHGGGGGGWHGGSGHVRGGHLGHRGYYRPGYFWGGVGLGLGIGAIGYYGSYWGNYYGPYGGYYAPYYGYYDDPPPVAPVYPRVDPNGPRTGQPVPQVAADPIFYPKGGQSAEATETDRRDCNRWATTQPGAMADASIFQRATYACMEGRGYTVK